jgi:hypothetical protein
MDWAFTVFIFHQMFTRMKKFENNVAKLDPISIFQHHSKILSDKPFLQKLKSSISASDRVRGTVDQEELQYCCVPTFNIYPQHHQIK